jgi:hypothetical protein
MKSRPSCVVFHFLRFTVASLISHATISGSKVVTVGADHSVKRCVGRNSNSICSREKPYLKHPLYHVFVRQVLHACIRRNNDGFCVGRRALSCIARTLCIAIKCERFAITFMTCADILHAGQIFRYSRLEGAERRLRSMGVG